MRPEIVLAETITSEMEQVIGSGLNRFNDDVTGYTGLRSIAVVARDPVT